MTSAAQSIIESIRNLAETIGRETGEVLPEVWLERRAYDAVSAEALERMNRYLSQPLGQVAPREEWGNGLIALHSALGCTMIRRAR